MAVPSMTFAWAELSALAVDMLRRESNLFMRLVWVCRDEYSRDDGDGDRMLLDGPFDRIKDGFEVEDAGVFNVALLVVENL
jgi:hypothetical protein